MKSNISLLLKSLDKQETEAKEDYHSKVDSVRGKLNTTILDAWDYVKEKSLLTESILRRLEGCYLWDYRIKRLRGKGTIGMGVGDYFEDLVADTLRRYLKSVFKKEWASGILQFFCGKRIKNRTPDIVIEIRNAPVIALEMKINFGKKELREAKLNRKNFSSESIEYFVVASDFTLSLFRQKEGKAIVIGSDKAKNLDWIYVIADWEWKKENDIETYKMSWVLNPMEPLFEKIRLSISRALKTRG